nr:TonB family protein [uncultured Roseovarius sp.]
MTRGADFYLFGGLALLVHLALWLGFAQGGLQSAGGGGTAIISLSAAPEQMARMVAEWDRPAEAMDTPPRMAMPETVAAALPRAVETEQRPAILSAPAPLVAMASPQPPQLAPEVTRAPPRPTVAEPPVASLRPKARPTQPTPKAQPATAAPQPQISSRQSQKAAGGQTGQNAGNSKVRTQATVSDAARQSHVAQWGAAIRARVERRKQYPTGTRASGRAVIRIKVAPTGRLISATLTTRTGDARLDRAAIKAVQSARFPKAPRALSAASYQFNLPISFRK